MEKGTAVLAQLGFHPDNVDMNLTILFGYLALALLLAYTVLARFVKEKRWESGRGGLCMKEDSGKDTQTILMIVCANIYTITYRL